MILCLSGPKTPQDKEQPMENQRALLYITLFFLMFLMWISWQQQNAPTPPVSSETQSAVSEVPDANNLPVQDRPAAGSTSLPAATAEETTAGGQRIRVITDVLDLLIDSQGGDIRELALREYPMSAQHMDKDFQLFSENPANYFISQSGLVAVGEHNREKAPDHRAIFQASATEYRLGEGEAELHVPLTWQQGGITVTKTYTFRRSDYVIDLKHEITTDDEPWVGSQYTQLRRSPPHDDGSSAFIYTYTGGVIYTQAEKYEKITFDEIAEQDLSRQAVGGWAAMIQHYFMAAWVPNQQDNNVIYSKHPVSNHYILGVVGSQQTVAPGETGVFQSRLVVGPKLQDALETVIDAQGNPVIGLELTVDYGVLTVIAKPLFWLLSMFHSLLGNWGWAIIFVTILVKAVFYKLSETSYRSMAKMRKLAPRLQTLKERYGDDRQRLSQAMMDMYKKEKINPLGGCLPMLVQIPVFIALYWVLLESVELRNAPFILWIDNLSEKDPFFILPVIMGLTMFLQYRLNPAPLDPIQQKIFMYMPLIFTFFFAFFPSGLVLYWVVNNILSIAQQWLIIRRMETEK